MKKIIFYNLKGAPGNRTALLNYNEIFLKSMFSLQIIKNTYYRYLEECLKK